MFESVDGSPLPYAGITHATPSIPKFYWDVDSQEQGIKQLWKIVCKISKYADAICEQTNINTKDIEELKETFNKFIESGFDDYYRKQLEQWFLDNVWRIYDRVAKQVYFGLTSDGYFCAYVPDGWKEIRFDTGAVYGRSDYGRLILRYEVDPAAQGVIDNTYSYTANDWNITGDILAKIDRLIADLETNSKRTDSAFDTLFTNLDKDIAVPHGDTVPEKSLVKGGENV